MGAWKEGTYEDGWNRDARENNYRCGLCDVRITYEDSQTYMDTGGPEGGGLCERCALSVKEHRAARGPSKLSPN